MKIILLSTSVSASKTQGDYALARPEMYPYGILCLASVLEKNGFKNIKILDVSLLNLGFDDVLREIGSYNPDIIGISTYSITAEHTIKLCTSIKERYKDKVVVAGGPHVTLFPREMMENKCFDFCCSGESDHTFTQLVKSIYSNESVSSIDGIIYRDNGTVIVNPPPAQIGNLDELPFPSFHLIGENISTYYPQPLSYKRRPVATLITSRGCPYSCNFCTGLGGKKWRFNSARYVADMTEKLVKEYGIKEVCFFEDSFAISKSRVIEICKLFIERKLNIAWTASVNINNIDEEMAGYMKASGCWLVGCGLESGNDEVLKFVGKPVTTEVVRKKAEMLDRIGIQIKAYFILGLPTDTKETIRQTIEFAKSLPLYTANFNLYLVAPGSELAKVVHQYGEVRGDFSLLTGFASETQPLSFVGNGLSESYLKEIQEEAFETFFFRYSQILRLLREIHGYEDIKRYFMVLNAYLQKKIKHLAWMMSAVLRQGH